jgi:hypothetical protein
MPKKALRISTKSAFIIVPYLADYLQNNHKNFETSRPAPINPLTHVYHGVAG